MFKYVLIPAKESTPITEQTASKSGGLSNDALSNNAKQYFFEQSGGAARAQSLASATPAQKKALAAQVRNQYASDATASKQLKDMDDDTIIKLIQAQEGSPTCEISCLTVPTPVNGHMAVSMYGDDNARNKGYELNVRATNLMKACGHAFPNDAMNEDGKPSGIYGDVFVGRCHDNEVEDIWERVDMTKDQVEGNLENMEWCKVAKKKGGGGGHGGAAASLSKTLQNYGKQQAGVGGVGGTAAITGNPGESDENGYKWSQTNDEVELKFAVAPGTKAKYVKVKFGARSLKVTVAGQTLCDGDTWGTVAVDESTFTLQDDPDKNSKGRELCISLGKKDEGETWNYAVMKK